MDTNQRSDRNMEFYRRIKGAIDQTYSHGCFVGIANDQIVGTAEKFPDLTANLRNRGFDPRQVMVVEAGVEYPDYVVIV